MRAFSILHCHGVFRAGFSLVMQTTRVLHPDYKNADMARGKENMPRATDVSPSFEVQQRSMTTVGDEQEKDKEKEETKQKHKQTNTWIHTS